MAGVVVPLYPGVYSAMASDVGWKHDYIRSKLTGLAALTAEESPACSRNCRASGA